MNIQTAQKLSARLPPDALVLDVGGGAAPFARADWVMDGLPFSGRGALAGGPDVAPVRYTAQTWVQWDLCRREPWPFPDRKFDFAVCTHVLEDVRDPVWVCSEMARVARSGYIAVPSRAVEQSLGVEHPCYAGYYHHRWLVDAAPGRLRFRFKPHSLHSLPGAVVARLRPWEQIAPPHEDCGFEWSGSFEAAEELLFDEAAVNAELCATAATWRGTPGLVTRRAGALRQMLWRWVYFQRLRFRRP